MISPGHKEESTQQPGAAALNPGSIENLAAKSSGDNLCYPPTHENPLKAVIPHQPTNYLASDVLMIAKAHKLMFEFYDQHTRNSGPNESLPLAHHASECGMFLSLAQYRWQVVVAGIFHDLLEGYVTFKHGKSIQDMCGIVTSNFGTEIIRMIEAASEPGRWDPNVTWAQRKAAALKKVRAHGSECAAISCAAKISTMRVGNAYLRKNGSVTGWSQGSHSDNVRMFAMFGKTYCRKLVAPVLQEMYENELTLFERGGIIVR